MSEAQSELDKREWRMQNDVALYDGMQLQSQRMELHQANQLTDETRREKSWQCDEQETEFFKKIGQEIVKKLKNY